MFFRKEIKLENYIISPSHPVFVIAEAGVNHNGDINLAKKLVEEAKAAGADAVKFQTFKAENLNTLNAPKSTYHIETTGSKGSWFDLLKTQELSREMHEILIEHCRQNKIMFLSTPYDEESADLLDALDVPAFKIASTDANNIPFLEYLAGKKRPILLSSAMCTLEEVLESVDAIAQAGCKDLIVFHCTANYPTRLADVHMRAMATLRDELDVLVGYSDHTLEDLTAVAAVSFGAVAYEKHFTLDKKLPGPDHRASLEPREFRMLVETIRKTENLLGSKEKAPLTVEEENRKKLRKSIVACRNLKKGEVIDAGMVCAKRPGTGLAPKYGDSLIGKRVKRDIFKDDFILLDDIEETADGQKA